MRAIVLDKVGGYDVLQVSEVDTPTPNDDQVLVKVKYSGINFADLISRRGLYSWAPERPYILGLEVAGEIVEVGENVDRQRIGERVFVGAQQGGYAEYTCTDTQLAMPVPDFYNWMEAGAFGAQWFTSWVGLHEMARVRGNETVLVHAAAGGVGSAAVKLALAHGMRVYGTASSHKREMVESMGATFLEYHDFDTELMKQGVYPNCIIETIGGDVFRRGYEILAPMGRSIQIGASGIHVNMWNPISLIRAWRAMPRTNIREVIRRSRGFMGLHVGYMLSNPDLMLPIWNEMIETINTHELRPVIREDQIFPMSRTGDAHKFMQDRKNIGKILLDPSR